MDPLEIPEILLNVCSFLDKNSLLAGSLVSHAWFQTCMPLLWNSCSFTAEQYNTYHTEYDQHAHLIQSMDAKYRVIGGDMRFIAHQCVNLTSLALRHCRVTPLTLQVLCGGIPRVQHLVLERCLGINAGIATKLTRLTRLSRLDITVHSQDRGSGDWRENDMAILFSQCSLESLTIIGPDLSHVHLLAIQRSEATLPFVHLHLESTFISATALDTLLQKCPRLLSLVLLHNANKNTTFQAITKNCSKLTRLELKNSKSVTTTAFDAVFKSCPLLTRLDISFTLIQDSSVSALVRCCPLLQSLDLTGCSRVSHVGFQEIVGGLSHLVELLVSQCSRLKAEAFSGTQQWACRQTLETLEMGSVGIRSPHDSLQGLVGHLESLVRLRRLTVDMLILEDESFSVFLDNASSVAVEIVPPHNARDA
ncbi:hypothetical protein BGW38_003351 [Lunasporangiospora selenospora]|uniref:F-box domain-containing protein n=1 Tax=Lunasporangiospora selenospora TaxID=979761 RepID=A0A9P6FRY6_9FUNG|nr:hypothetical protein BGW38_003351 [Lunasporangiospora selenospora]